MCNRHNVKTVKKLKNSNNLTSNHFWFHRRQSSTRRNKIAIIKFQFSFYTILLGNFFESTAIYNNAEIPVFNKQLKKIKRRTDEKEAAGGATSTRTWIDGVSSLIRCCKKWGIPCTNMYSVCVDM